MSFRNMGSPKGGDPYGDGVPMVVDGVTSIQGERESRLQGEVGQVSQWFWKPCQVREMLLFEAWSRSHTEDTPLRRQEA